MNRKNARQESAAPRSTRASKRQRMQSPTPPPIVSPSSPPAIPHGAGGAVIAADGKDVPAPDLAVTTAVHAPTFQDAVVVPNTIVQEHAAVASTVPGAALAGMLKELTSAPPPIEVAVVPETARAPATALNIVSGGASASMPSEPHAEFPAVAFAPVTAAPVTTLSSTSDNASVVAAPAQPTVASNTVAQTLSSQAIVSAGGFVPHTAVPRSTGADARLTPVDQSGVAPHPASENMAATAPAGLGSQQGGVPTSTPATGSNLSGNVIPAGSAVPPATQALLPAAAVQDPTPRPTVTFTEFDYVPPEIITRLRNIVRYREVTSNRFALTMIPRSADWGRAPRTEKILCLGGKPVLVWLIGRIRSLWFFDRNGDPHLRVNLGFTLHSAEERAAAGELFGRSRPRGDSAPTTIYAGKLCSQRERGEYCHTASAFTQVYDAKTRLTAKSAMPQISPVELGTNDIVVVECLFTRWRPATDGKAKKSWTTFDVGFELMSIFLLHSAPADLPDGDGVDAADEITGEL